jgi:DNA-binding GntR family transcriptional regulator
MHKYALPMPLISIELPGRRSRSLELYEHLRAAIFDGTLRPGERLVETGIAAKASVSRTPVREAIRMLHADGLVLPSTDGVVVSGLDADEMSELCVVREALEGLACRLAATARSEIDLLTLDGLIEECDHAAAAGDMARLAFLSHSFHRVIWNSTGNRYLAAQLTELKERIDRNQPSTLLSPGRADDAFDEHRALLAAFRARDADGAETVAREHFRRAMAVRLTRDQVELMAGTR